MMQSKRGAGPAVLILIAVIIVLVIVWAYNVVARQCNSDLDCPQDYYCGSDFECHEQKIIERTIVYNYNFMGAAFVIAIGIIVAAIILKSKRIKHILGLD